MRRLGVWFGFVALVVPSALHRDSARPAAAPDAQTASAVPAELASVIRDAFGHAYNLDETEALAAARRTVVVAPDEPSAHRALATILWLDILFRRGTLVSDHYLSGGLKAQAGLPKPPADLDGEFKRALAKAIELAEARMARDPRSIQARYEAGAAYALHASYMASVEGRLLGALRMAKRAYDTQEYVLAREPQRLEAGLVVGTYRYLIAILPLPMRVMAYVVGFGGGKERGVALVEGATRARETEVDAKVTLLLMYNRERRYVDAVRTAHELGRQFPKNRLFVLEEGSAATSAGRAAEADALLTRGLAAFDVDDRPKIPGERAMWLYRRALARIALRRLPEAKGDLDTALGSQLMERIRGRVQLELGRLADLTGRRPDAIGAYRQAQRLCAVHNDSRCADEAGQLIKRPFRF